MKRAETRTPRTGARRLRRFTVGQPGASDVASVPRTTQVEAAGDGLAYVLGNSPTRSSVKTLKRAETRAPRTGARRLRRFTVDQPGVSDFARVLRTRRLKRQEMGLPTRLEILQRARQSKR